MNPNSSSRSNFLSGLLGGLVVLVLGAVLIGTDVIDTGDTTREVVRERRHHAARQRHERRQGPHASRTSTRTRAAASSSSRRAASAPASSPRSACPRSQGGTATGSGFVVDKEGTIITNAHVVEGASDVQVRFGEERTTS